MPDSFAGITMPEGDPGALADAGQRMGEVGRQLNASATELQGMPSTMGSWQGPASASYAGTCLSQSDAVSRQADGWIMAAGVAKVFSTELEDAREEARNAIRDAQRATDRMKKAQTELNAAKGRFEEANGRMAGALVELAADGLTGGSLTGARDSLRRAQEDADQAEREMRHWRREYEDAEDELERAQRRGERAEQKAKDAASTASTMFAAIQTGMPRLVLPAPPPPPPPAEEDKPWYEDAADWTKGAVSWTGEQAKGVGVGAWEGVEGMAAGGVMLYRLSNINRAIDPESHAREQAKLGEAAKFAWNNPGEFGKALINYEDLAAGRYGEWIGNLAPDAAAAIITGGAAPVVSRSLKGADTAGDLARNAERLSEGGRAYERATGAHGGLPDAFGKKTSASNGDPTLSGWKQPRPDGFGGATPEDIQRLSNDIGHDLKPNFLDQKNRPDGFEGKYNASHAEKQQALTSPGSDIAVTRPMCNDCVDFHRKLAEHTGQPQLVTDPNTSRLFLPDGRVVESPGIDDFPRLQDPSRFDGGAAAAGGAGSEGLSATQRDGGR